MLNYCLNEVECRRALIAKCFGEKWKPEDCVQNCDICKSTSQIVNRTTSSSTLSQNITLQATSSTRSHVLTHVEEDITQLCRNLIEIIEHAQSKDQKLTALKLIESWRGIGSSSNKVKHVPVTKLSETNCERVLLRALLDGVLKEDFHFTPYSTISYIGLGRSTIAVKKGMLRVTMKVREDSSTVKKIPSSKGTDAVASPKKKSGKKAQQSASCNFSKKGKESAKRKLPAMILEDVAEQDDLDFLPRPNLKKIKLSSEKTKAKTPTDNVIEIIDSD